MNRPRIVALFVASLLYFASLYIYVPTLPAYITLQTSSLATVGTVLSMYGLWMAVLRIPVGVAADATGRLKPFLVGGFLLAGIGALVMGLGSSLGALAFGRALTGASAAAWVPMMVAFAALFPVEQTLFATSLLSFASSFGQMMGTSVTGFLNALGGYRLSFYVAGGLALAASVIMAAVKLPGRSTERRVTAGSLLSLFTVRSLLVPSLASALCQLGVWAVTFGFLPLLARQVGANVVTVSLLMTVNVAANAAANLLATLAARRGSGRGLLYASFAVFAAGTVAAALAHSVPPLFVSAVLTGAANGLFFPVLLGLSIEGIDASHRTTAMGIHQAIYAVGMFCGPWIGGVLADAVGIRVMFALMAAFCLAAPSALVGLIRKPGGAGQGTSP